MGGWMEASEIKEVNAIIIIFVPWLYCVVWIDG